MSKAIGQLLTTRRGFLLRASAVTAAGATVAVPIVAMPADPVALCIYHGEQLAAACRAYYEPFGLSVRFHGNRAKPSAVWDEHGLPATWMVTASIPEGDPRRLKFGERLEALLNQFGR